MAGRRSLTTPLSGPRRKRPNRRPERSARTYSPNLVEGGFCEVGLLLNGFLRTSPRGCSKKFVWLLCLGAVVFVASSLPVAVGCLAHRFLLFQAGPQGS